MQFHESALQWELNWYKRTDTTKLTAVVRDFVKSLDTIKYFLSAKYVL